MKGILFLDPPFGCQISAPRSILILGGLNFHTETEDSGTDRGTSLSQWLNFKLSLGGGFKYFLFSPLPGEMIQID